MKKLTAVLCAGATALALGGCAGRGPMGYGSGGPPPGYGPPMGGPGMRMGGPVQPQRGVIQHPPNQPGQYRCDSAGQPSPNATGWCVAHR